MIAVNDEATGMVVDALSHSPLWPKTLIVVTEDDPQNGADHVDVHRTILMMTSPWVKRGYVSSGHYDMASVHKLMLTILGVPYPNEEIASAPLPYDAFTSTPDYTPYDYEPRSYDKACNPGGDTSRHARRGLGLQRDRRSARDRVVDLADPASRELRLRLGEPARPVTDPSTNRLRPAAAGWSVFRLTKWPRLGVRQSQQHDPRDGQADARAEQPAVEPAGAPVVEDHRGETESRAHQREHAAPGPSRRVLPVHAPSYGPGDDNVPLDPRRRGGTRPGRLVVALRQLQEPSHRSVARLGWLHDCPARTLHSG